MYMYIHYTQVKVAADMSESVSKYSVCSWLHHPRYPIGTLVVVCSRNNSIGENIISIIISSSAMIEVERNKILTY